MTGDYSRRTPAVCDSTREFKGFGKLDQVRSAGETPPGHLGEARTGPRARGAPAPRPAPAGARVWVLEVAAASALECWLGDQDSNLGWRSQSPQSYR